MITTFIAVLGLTFEDGRIRWQNWNTRNTLAAIQIVKFTIAAHGESLADVTLVDRENIHRKVLRFHENLGVLRVFRNAPKHERRSQRNRIETVNGNSSFLSIFIKCCNYGNPGRETT